jgi:hypothetical protein
MIFLRKGEDPPWIVADSLWERIEPLLAKVERRRTRYPGLRRLGDRKVLCGILFVLHTGIRRECLPEELGFGLSLGACLRTVGLPIISLCEYTGNQQPVRCHGNAASPAAES